MFQILDELLLIRSKTKETVNNKVEERVKEKAKAFLPETMKVKVIQHFHSILVN